MNNKFKSNFYKSLNFALNKKELLALLVAFSLFSVTTVYNVKTESKFLNSRTVASSLLTFLSGGILIDRTVKTIKSTKKDKSK